MEPITLRDLKIGSKVKINLVARFQFNPATDFEPFKDKAVTIKSLINKHGGRFEIEEHAILKGERVPSSPLPISMLKEIVEL